jgi:hypothetical protein
MTKKGAKKQALGWIPSSFDEVDLKKAKREGFLSKSMKIIFHNTEAIPSPPAVFRVMFFAFLLRVFSLPAHEFLCGLLFVYGVQLHQLMPNSLMHIACFITLCEAFLDIDPTGFFGNISFACALVVPKAKFLSLAVPSSLCGRNRNILISKWPNQFKVGDS